MGAAAADAMRSAETRKEVNMLKGNESGMRKEGKSEARGFI